MDVRSLDEREERAWRGFHRMRVGLTSHLARQLTQECGLTEADYAVLVIVSEAPGARIRARDLGLALGWDRSRLSHQLARMEARGTVRRAPCEHDARGFDVVLTDAGLAVIQAAAPLHLEAVRHCFADLLTPDQLDTLGDIAEIVTAHLAVNHRADTGDDESGGTGLAGGRALA
jgi:DNA-binding MarR family transcriptional regulator